MYKKSRSVLVQLQKIKMKKKFDVVSLFSGCGGFDLGFTGNFKFLKQNFSKTNFNIIWSNDIDRSSCETYKKNLNGHIGPSSNEQWLSSSLDSKDPRVLVSAITGKNVDGMLETLQRMLVNEWN